MLPAGITLINFQQKAILRSPDIQLNGKYLLTWRSLVLHRGGIRTGIAG
jgi:hypothetical protein